LAEVEDSPPETPDEASSHFSSITPRELAAIQAALPTLSLQEKVELFEALEEKERRLSRDLAKTNLIGFAKHVYPGFKVGPHHKKLAPHLRGRSCGQEKAGDHQHRPAYG
jgi:phage gp29-like protein